MFFDDPGLFEAHDRQNMHAEIEKLPDQLEEAWQSASDLPLPGDGGIDRVIVAGMGGSAIGADLVSAYLAPDCPVPVITHRGYGLPGWAFGSGTLVVASSHSGNTEETLSAYEAARERGCRLVTISTGGRLRELAGEQGVPHWRFEHSGQPRAGVGYSFGLLLGLFSRLGWVEDPAAEVAAAAAAMRAQAAQIVKSIPEVQNPAKRYAGQLMGRSFVVFGAEFLAPVARRWKTQVNELAKAWASFEELPEANHNALVGLARPESLTQASFAMFLASPGYSERNRLRLELTRRAYMLEGVSTDFYLAQGEGRLAQQWTALQFGDFMAYYLAIAYGVDPTPVEALEEFKREMRGE